MIRKLCLRLSEKKTQTSVAKSKDFQDNEMFKQGQWECFRKVKDFILILMSIKEIYVWNLVRFIFHCSIFWSAMHCIVSFIPKLKWFQGRRNWLWERGGLFILIKPITICTKGAHFLVVLTMIFEVPSALDSTCKSIKKYFFASLLFYEACKFNFRAIQYI